MMGVIPVSTLLGVSRQNQSFSSALSASDLTASRLPSFSGYQQCASSVGQKFGLPAIVNSPVTDVIRSCVCSRKVSVLL